MVALGELLPLPVAIFTTTQLRIDSSKNKILALPLKITTKSHTMWYPISILLSELCFGKKTKDYRNKARQGKASLFISHISYTVVIQSALHKRK